MLSCRRGVIVCVAWLSAPLLAAESPLDVMPPHTSVVVRVKNPSATLSKVAAFVDTLEAAPDPKGPAQPTWGAMVRAAPLNLPGDFQRLGVWLGSPTHGGADVESDWWVLLLVTPDAPPRVVFAIPAANAAELQGALGKETPFVQFEKWTIFGSDAKTIDEIKQRVVGGGDSFAGAMDVQTKAAFSKGDMAAFVNLPTLMAVFGNSLASVGAIQGYLGLLSPAADRPPALQEKISQLQTLLAEAANHGLNDSAGLALSLSVAATEVRVEAYSGVKADSPSSAFLKSSPGSDMQALAQLPASSVSFFGLNANLKPLMGLVSEIVNFRADDERSAEEREHLRKAYEQLEYGTIVSAIPMLPIDQGAMRVVTITEVNDVDKARELERQQFASISTTFNPDAEKYGEHSADVATGSKTLMAVTNVPDEKVMKVLYGPDGLTIRTVYLKDRILQLVGGTQPSVEAALKQALNPVGVGKGDAALLARTLQKLGERQNFIALIDLCGLARGYLGMAAEMMKSAGQTGPPFGDALKALDLPPTLASFSVGCEPQAIRVNLSVPLKPVQAIALGLQKLNARQANSEVAAAPAAPLTAASSPWKKIFIAANLIGIAVVGLFIWIRRRAAARTPSAK